MTLGELYRAAKTALEPVTEDPTFEAACLLEHFCGANRTELLLHGDKPAESEAEQAVLSALEKRKTGEPLQYLLGEWDFMNLTLSCGEGVLIPREDTAVLVEAVCKRLSLRRHGCGGAFHREGSTRRSDGSGAVRRRIQLFKREFGALPGAAGDGGKGRHVR